MNYIERYHYLRRQVAVYEAGVRTGGVVDGRLRDRTVKRWRRAERDLANLKDYLERHGIAA
jgi:hypothetical protein